VVLLTGDGASAVFLVLLLVAVRRAADAVARRGRLERLVNLVSTRRYRRACEGASGAA